MKISFGRLLIMLLILILASMIYGFWLILTPRWSFTVTTNKTDYALGEDVRITVTLKNTGLIPQSMTSPVADPVMLWIEFASAPGAYAWFSDVHKNLATFTIAPGQALTRVFIWNQTWWDKTNYPGAYFVQAAIPEPSLDDVNTVTIGYGRQFYAYSEINITAT